MKKVGITVVAAVCVVLLCVGFYFMKNSDGSQASKENLTVVQRINEKNLTDDYPKTPRAVIKLYNQIITSYYSGNYTDDEFDKLIDQARMLFDQDLAELIIRIISGIITGNDLVIQFNHCARSFRIIIRQIFFH